MFGFRMPVYNLFYKLNFGLYQFGITCTLMKSKSNVVSFMIPSIKPVKWAQKS